MSEDNVRELQLNGKQLVFLFMATIVAGVVVFLLGVMVGRDMRAPREVAASDIVPEASVDPTRELAPPPSTSTSGDERPVTVDEDLTYSTVLDGTTPDDTLQEPADDTRPAASAPPSAPAERRVPSPETTAADAAPPEPPGNGFVVQVSAVTSRREADAIAKRLAAKGYRTFVTVPAKGTPAFFRVRIGKYGDRREAGAIAARLSKEEQFQPWITR